MPRITVDAREGRTVEQKRGLVRDITEAVVKHFNVEPRAVTIVFTERSPENVAMAGTLLIDSRP